MSTHTEKIQLDVQMQSGAGEVMRLAATVLFFGGIGCLAWAVADGGYAELAATGLTVMGAQIIRLLWNKGVITAPRRKPGEVENFGESKALLNRIAAEYRTWLSRSGMLRLVLIAFGYALLFLIFQAGAMRALLVFQNIYIAGALGAVIGAFIVAPQFLAQFTDPLKSKGVLNPGALNESESGVSSAQPVQPATEAAPRPAPQSTLAAPVGAQKPVAKPAPAKPAPAPAAQKVVKKVVRPTPVTKPEQAPTPTQQRVVRRVVRAQENSSDE